MSAKRTREDLSEAFGRRVRLMRSAAERFDAGEEDAGFEMAVHLRVLLHDTSQSHSILAQLGVKAGLRRPRRPDPGRVRSVVGSRGANLTRVRTASVVHQDAMMPLCRR